MTRYQEATYDFETLRIPKMLYDLGRPDILNELSSYSLNSDDFGEMVMTAIDAVFEFVDNNWKAAGDKHIATYSDPAMEKFYRLARRYSSQQKIPLKKNPYLLEAKAVVDSYLDIDTESSSYELHTNAQNCCIIFYHDCFFDGQEELLEGLIRILNYYRDKSAALRKELGITPAPHTAPLCKKA